VQDKVNTSAAGAERGGGGEWVVPRPRILFLIVITMVQFRAFLRVFKCLKPKITKSKTKLLVPLPIVA